MIHWQLASRRSARVPVCSYGILRHCHVAFSAELRWSGPAHLYNGCRLPVQNIKLNMASRVSPDVCNAVLAVSLQTEDMFFDPDDMDKFADEGTMDDDLEGGWLVEDESYARRVS